MNKVIVSHSKGWSCTLTADVKTQVYKKEGEFKKRTVAILTQIFDTGGSIPVGETVDVLVRDGSAKKHYTAKVMARSRSGAVKLHLVASGDDTTYNTILEKLKGGQ